MQRTECNAKVLVALGGNAILKHREKGTKEEQFENVRETCRHLVGLIKDGYSIAITHGNGPQVGDILLKNELAKDVLPPMPLDVCGAESQGMIGYMLQQTLACELHGAGIQRPVATVLTQTLVRSDDPAFHSPSKPIGPFYTALEASRLRKESGWTIAHETGRGYRRVVPSPNPIDFIEKEAIHGLCASGVIVIACGGGGIPVVAMEDGLAGVEAVVDKDLSAALLATLIRADHLLILTDVDQVYADYGRPRATPLSRLTVSAAEKYMEEGEFPPGTMGPKIEAAIRFIRDGGISAVITTPGRARVAMSGEAGTTIIPDT
ncbi:MAG: carbamate kinase [Methanobacteriota archaeon]|nr:MAG: carbamate kinase [Euryarchaeota archaeon]